jgi:hypothetical protein
MNTPTVYLAATGQTTSYVTGDDGNYKAGVTVVNPRFTTVGDCITDNLTGLMWIKDLNMINGGQNTIRQNGVDLINEANKTRKFCGHDDWYLPTVNELLTLISYNQSDPASWLNMPVQGFSHVKSEFYWSSTSPAGQTLTRGWHVNFDSGVLANNVNTNNAYIWPVRRTFSAPAKTPVTGETNSVVLGSASGESWPQPRFIVGNESGASANCVTDKLTGLMWVRHLNTVKINGTKNGESTTWQNAIISVENANYCGYTDWRLPNITELKSLINYGQGNSVTWLNTQGFDSVPTANYYWSSTRLALSTANLAWGVDMRYGSLDAGYNTLYNNVWPVRGGRRP